jgi:hypothetical protein
MSNSSIERIYPRFRQVSIDGTELFTPYSIVDRERIVPQQLSLHLIALDYF